MTARAFYTLLFGAVMLITALSVGSQGVFLLGVCALIACALALVSLLFAVLTCRISQQLSQSEINRGESCMYTLCVSMCCVLPIAPLSLRLNLPNGKTSEFSFAPHLFGRTESDNLFPCPHVGVFSVGAVSVSFGDVFGLFRFSRPVKAPLIPVCVLPVPRETQPLATSPGEGEST